MINLLKPGHVLRFGTCPKSIDSPLGVMDDLNDNSLESLWPNTNNLGVVQAISHPNGPIGDVAAEIAVSMRPGQSNSRSASYSGVGRAFTQANRILGAEPCGFVGYTDGRSFYINSLATVFSKDFSGCTMVVYNQGGARRVAHSAASGVPHLNCRHAFMTTLQANGAALIGWFKPYTVAMDEARKLATYHAVKNHIGHDIGRVVTFGVVTATNVPYSIEAIKPTTPGVGATDWVVTHVAPRTLSNSWVVP